jgi:hypothetical protein
MRGASPRAIVLPLERVSAAGQACLFQLGVVVIVVFKARKKELSLRSTLFLRSQGFGATTALFSSLKIKKIVG